MRLPRPRFSLRRLLVAIAVVALVFGLVVRPYLDRVRWGRVARYHHDKSQVYWKKIEAAEPCDPSYEKWLALFRWHQSMAARHARAAAYPGMPEPHATPAPYDEP